MTQELGCEWSIKAEIDHSAIEGPARDTACFYRFDEPSQRLLIHRNALTVCSDAQLENMTPSGSDTDLGLVLDYEGAGAAVCGLRSSRSL